MRAPHTAEATMLVLQWDNLVMYGSHAIIVTPWQHLHPILYNVQESQYTVYCNWHGKMTLLN